MVVVTCGECGTVQEYSIFEDTTPCRACNASAEYLLAVEEAGVDPPEDPDPRTVLVAEDDDAFRETVSQWSTIDDWVVQKARDGQAALDGIDGEVDVLVLDRHMPELSGPELIDRLDETPFDGDVLVVSAFEADTDLNEADVDGYLTKPVSRKSFVDALRLVTTA